MSAVQLYRREDPGPGGGRGDAVHCRDRTHPLAGSPRFQTRGQPRARGWSERKTSDATRSCRQPSV